jgi:RHS repeat-associated protein
MTTDTRTSAASERRADRMAVTQYVWDQDNILYETDGNDAVNAEYTYSPEQYGELISEHRNGETYTHYYDAQGSTLAMTDEAGHVTDRFTYNAWGEEVARIGTTETPWRWIGRVGYCFDGDRQFHAIRNRSYCPVVARWNSLDPLRVGITIRGYEYTKNSPMNYTDASGLECDSAQSCCCCAWGASISPVGIAARYEDKIPPQEGDEPIYPRWGHRFVHTSTLNYVIGNEGKCTFEWFECTTALTAEARRLGIKEGEWFDAHKLQKDFSKTSENWLKYETGEKPYDVLPCPGKVPVASPDTPVMNLRNSRTLKFAIRVSSAKECPCPTDSITIYATQTLQQGGPQRPEIWDFRIGIDWEQPPRCGKVPFAT